jgi:O-antigen/teichoic acid export membrane protein
MSRLKQLSKDSLIYGIGGVIAKSVSFFTLPIYTRIFTPADYGTIEMLTVMSSFLAAILVMGMDSAQSMYFFKHKDDGRDAQARVVSSILQWRLICGAGIVFIATLFAPLLNAAFFNGKLGWEYFAVAFVGTLFAQVMSQSAEVMRLLYRPWGYIGITLSQSLLSAALVLVAVLVFDQGIFGFFLGTGVAVLAVGSLGWYRVREYINFERLHTDWWPQLVRFGAPLVPAGLAMYFMNTADRWFVQHYHGEEALGIFAVGAKFALLMALGVETFRKAWWPIAMDAMHSDDGPETFRLIARLYMGFGIAAVTVLTLISPWLVQWFTAPAFHGAWPIVGILAWQALFYGFFLIVSAGIWKAEKTYVNLYLMAGAAMIGLLLNWLLVPMLGGMGAALATVITYFGWVVASMVVSERLWRVTFPVKLFGIQILLSGGMVAWFVLTDLAVATYLKLAIGVALSLLIAAITMPASFYSRLRNRLAAA